MVLRRHAFKVESVGIRARTVFRRHFAYEDTLAYRLHGPKPVCFVIHPVFPEKRNKLLSIQEAEEALGLARAAKWDVILGPSEPRGGWNHETLAQMERYQHLRKLHMQDDNNPNQDPNSEWYVDKGDKSKQTFFIKKPKSEIYQLFEKCEVEL